jgi:CubicO group peptidase (beta-lactamase class C family)
MPYFFEIDHAMKEAVEEGVFPGAVLLVGVGEEILLHQAYGQAARHPQPRPMQLETVFDLASLTKPLATALAAMGLVAQGRLHLDDPVENLGEPFSCPGKDKITLRQLLAHSAGFPAWQPYYLESERWEGDRKAALRQMVRGEPLQHPPGSQTLYSDLGFIFLDWILEEVSGRDLHTWTRDYVYRPLGLNEMGFRPLTAVGPESFKKYAATEDCPWRKKILCGEVHDENAYAAGGVSGQAGLFGTALEVFRLLRELKQAYDNPAGSRLFDGNLVRTFWARQESPKDQPRALGYDIPSGTDSSAGRFISPKSIGHLGFTGTSFWFDLDRDLLVILLTNRVHMTRTNEKIKQFRPLIHDRIFSATDPSRKRSA